MKISLPVTVHCSEKNCEATTPVVLRVQTEPEKYALVMRGFAGRLPPGWRVTKFVPGVIVPPTGNKEVEGINVWCPEHGTKDD